MALIEAEIQVLATIYRAESENTPVDPARGSMRRAPPPEQQKSPLPQGVFSRTVS